MQSYILKKDHLKSFLRKLTKDRSLVAPVKNRFGDTLFSEIADLDQVEIDLHNQAQSPLKSFFFPQQEVLFEYTNEESGTLFRTTDFHRPTVFFGLRSCDLSALFYMDVIFLRNKKDPYYRRRREDSLLINYVCNDPFENCFCRQTKSGPFLMYGFDLQLTDLGDRFFVEVGRAAGNKLIQQWGQFFQQANQDDERAQYQVQLEAQGGFKRRVLVDLALRKIQEGLVPDTVWEVLSSRCQDCGGCAYICPTCTCFSLHDRSKQDGSGERLRVWDACTFAGFTTMAGGHNPIDMKRERIKRRFLHKLYFDVKAHNRPSCVGCGRCVDMCFGGVDIIRFIEMVAAA